MSHLSVRKAILKMINSSMSLGIFFHPEDIYTAHKIFKNIIS